MFLGKAPRPDDCATWLPRQRTSAPALERLDLLARMPIPLRRPFKMGMERVAVQHSLEGMRAHGGEWYAPFDALMAAPGLRPAMVATPWSPDSCCDHLLAGAEPVHLAPPSVHAPCTGLMDPLGIFTVFAAIPLVFLIDHRKLGERSAPRRWSDLLEPGLRGDVVFGGWRPHAGVPFTDYNQFLLLCLLEEFGADGIRAFAASVKGLQHNVVSARTAGADNAPGGAVAVLPWMQAEMAPRRAQVSVVWPDDGAYAMPIGFVARPNRLGRVRPLVETLIGTELGGVLARNCYPPANGAVAGAFPPGAGLKWPGWERVREGGMTAQAERAGRLFFDAWGG